MTTHAHNLANVLQIHTTQPSKRTRCNQKSTNPENAYNRKHGLSSLHMKCSRPAGGALSTPLQDVVRLMVRFSSQRHQMHLYYKPRALTVSCRLPASEQKENVHRLNLTSWIDYNRQCWLNGTHLVVLLPYFSLYSPVSSFLQINYVVLDWYSRQPLRHSRYWYWYRHNPTGFDCSLRGHRGKMFVAIKRTWLCFVSSKWGYIWDLRLIWAPKNPATDPPIIATLWGSGSSPSFEGNTVSGLSSQGADTVYCMCLWVHPCVHWRVSLLPFFCMTPFFA